MNTGVVIVAGVVGALALVVISIGAYLIWDRVRSRNTSLAESYRRHAGSLHSPRNRASQRRSRGWSAGAAGLGGLWMVGQNGSVGSDGDAGTGSDGGGSCGGGCGGGGGGGGGGCGGS